MGCEELEAEHRPQLEKHVTIAMMYVVSRRSSFQLPPVCTTFATVLDRRRRHEVAGERPRAPRAARPGPAAGGAPGCSAPV